MNENLRYTGNCVQGGPPPCTCHCPFNFDIKGFLTKIKAGNFKSAYKDYRNKVAFPYIVSRLCDAPCQKICPVNENILLLERASIEFATNLSSEKYNLPKRDGKIAVIGGGLSGLACALRLATKKYSVTVFERNRACIESISELIEYENAKEDIERQFANIEYTLLTETEITGPEAIKELRESGFDAVYIATGEGGLDFGLLDGWNPQSLATVHDGVFLGGRITGCGHIDALAQGLTAAISIETWLKIHSMAGMEISWYVHECSIEPADNTEGTKTIQPANGISYTSDEAVEEAGHCLHCDCTICYDTCEFMKEVSLMPRMIEVNATNERGPIQRNSNRLIASCTLCGHCESACDFDASVEKAMKAAKKTLFETEGFAPAYHDFYLRDMETAMGEDFLLKTAPGYDNATYLFFPGCQAPKDNPGYVTEIYRYLLNNHPDTALMLACCGVPALYAGDYQTMNSVQDVIREKINSISDPVIVVLCAACARTFREFLPELRVISLFEYICENGLPGEAKAPTGKRALFDPCASRKFPEMQNAVRNLLAAVGAEIEELPENQSRALCCGQGGHIYAANPGLSKKFTAAAISQSDLPYIAYCTNCRNIFLTNGKETDMLLDTLFGFEPLSSPLHFTDRDMNRRRAKRNALLEFWGEETGEAVCPDINVTIPENVLKKMDAQLLKESEVVAAIFDAEENRSYFEIPEKDVRVCGMKIGIITVWAEYKRSSDGFEVVNAYNHRIEFLPYEG